MKKLFFVAALGVLFISCGEKQGTALYTMNRMQEKTGDAEIVMDYPAFTQQKAINAEIKKTVFDDYAAHQALMAEYGMTTREYFVSSAPIIYNDAYVSILFSAYIYAGGANGETKLNSLTYSLKDNKRLSITEAAGMSLEDISKICANRLRENLISWNMDPEAKEMREELIAEGTAPRPENYTAFTFDGSVVTVFFAPYTVGTRVDGIQKVEIPLPMPVEK